MIKPVTISQNPAAAMQLPEGIYRVFAEEWTKKHNKTRTLMKQIRRICKALINHRIISAPAMC